MALSKSSVEKAYEVCHLLELREIPDNPLDIYHHAETWEQENPREFTLYGNDLKVDGGWEELMFFVKKENLTSEFVSQWEDQKGKLTNTSFGPIDWKKNDLYSVFGWY